MQSHVFHQDPFKVIKIRKTNPDFSVIEQGQAFTNIEDISGFDDKKEQVLFELNMVADRKNKYYTHESESLLSYIGDIGGIQGIVIGIVFSMVMPLVVHSMNESAQLWF